MKVVIIGSGNVAESLARAVRESDNTLVQVFARNKERGRIVAEIGGTEWCDTPAQLAKADLYLISVSDRAIAEISASLPFPEGAIVAHTAGCGTLEMLPKRCHRAVIYPFQTFTAGRAVDMRKVFLVVEAEESKTLEKACTFASTLSDHVERADASVREKIHLTGVLACNFVNNLYGTAAEVLQSANLPFDVLIPVIEETAAKAVSSGNPASVQTGPAMRGDMPTLNRHRALIGENHLLRTIYDTISENIWRIKETLKR